MKGTVSICLLLFCAAGCSSSRSRTESFAAFHSQIVQKLAGRYECGPVAKNVYAHGHSFEITPTNSGCRVFVSEEKFFTQKEWDKRHTAGTNLLIEFMTMAATNHEINARTVRRFAKMYDLLDLPGWSYKNIGLDVRVDCPEIAYPELEKQSAEAQHLFDEVVSLLKPYR